MIMKKKYVSREISPSFEDAHYYCWNCEKELTTDIPWRTVKCPDCGENITVYYSFNDWNYCLKRKYVQEIRKHDLVQLRDMKSYEVLDVREHDSDDSIYKVALQGYRSVNLEKDDWVDCIWGTWDYDQAPWNK